jgi:hypothetical protein
LPAIVVLAGLAATPAVAAAVNQRAAIALTRPMPNPVRVGQTVRIAGVVRRAPGAADAVLETKRSPERSWGVVARAGLRRGGRFTLRWRIPGNPGPVFWRVAAVRKGAVLTSTPAQQELIGQAPVYCKPPPPIMPNIPAGDGWIVGGAYIEGGPAPGIYECISQPYTVTALDQSGAAVATQQVAGGHSYTLVVPAGRYSLKVSTCGSGSAEVTAGKQTHADSTCPVP